MNEERILKDFPPEIVGEGIAHSISCMLSELEGAMKVGGRWRLARASAKNPGSLRRVWKVVEVKFVGPASQSKDDVFILERGLQRLELSREELVRGYRPASAKGGMSPVDSGRLGGKKTRDTHPGLYRKIGATGGKKTAERGPEYYQEIGRKGGLVNRQVHGLEYFSELGKKGGAKMAEKGPEYFKALAQKSVDARRKKSA